MASAVTMIHPQSGLEKTGYIGFSWTSFFFSGIPAMTRGDVGIGLGVLIGTIVLGGFSLGLLGAIVNLIWAFVYNKMYTTKLIESGYEIVDTEQAAGRARDALGIQPGQASLYGQARSQPRQPDDFDRRKWNALLQYDADIKRIADQLAPYGQKYVDQLAAGYLALNDKNYLPQIIQTILATAREDASRMVVEEGVSNNFSWRRYSNNEIEAKIDNRWTQIQSLDQLRGLPLTRSV